MMINDDLFMNLMPFCVRLQSFIQWFSFAPLMPTLKSSLKLTDNDIKYANFASVSTTVITRVIVGPMCDSYGPKVTLAVILVVSAIPSLLAGLVVHDATSLILIRAAIGVAGSSFVAVQSWIPLMFSRQKNFL